MRNVRFGEVPGGIAADLRSAAGAVLPRQYRSIIREKIRDRRIAAHASAGDETHGRICGRAFFGICNRDGSCGRRRQCGSWRCVEPRSGDFGACVRIRSCISGLQPCIAGKSGRKGSCGQRISAAAKTASVPFSHAEQDHRGTGSSRDCRRACLS